MLSDERWRGDLLMLVEMLAKVPGLTLVAPVPGLALGTPAPGPVAAATPVQAPAAAARPGRWKLVAGGVLADVVGLVLLTQLWPPGGAAEGDSFPDLAGKDTDWYIQR